MMKRLLPLFLVLLACTSACLGTLIDADEAADGYLTTGEYDASAVTLEYNEELFVIGGGANWVEARDYGYIEVQNTSTPLSNSSGIYDITLYDNSDLLYLNGVTEEITVRDNATAVLKGGRVDYITIYHLASWSSNVTVYCQAGYQKNQSGISGLWADGTAFEIDFINVGGVFASYPTANYVNVEIVPEPATLVLLGIGGLLLRRKR